MARRDAPRRPPPIWARGWPHLTPMYLLRGYSRMLADAEDVARRVICCTDRSRHDRMQLHHLVDVVELELITVNVAASRLVESGFGDMHSIEVGPLAPTIVVGARAAVLTGC